MSLFPSLLSLSNHQNHQQQTIPSSPTKGNNNTNTDSTTIENINNSQQRKSSSGSDVSGQEVSIRISAFSAEGVEIGKQKSAWTKSSPTGEVQFNDAQASFQISRHELEECAIQVDMFGLNNSAWPPLLRRKQKIGTLMLSDRRENDCSSSSDAQAHWQEMIQGMGLTLDKWHLLD
ncbi:hypothetical protein ACQ4LE_007616 [Meloidogyne hapla]|uniref:DUF4780 domain-containing protein n=1 Tax=Meloidogyne hapla TaxID=6305 RepID=A0A1I8BHH0_MELHA